MNDLHTIYFEPDVELDEVLKIDPNGMAQGEPDFRIHSYYANDTESVRAGVFESKSPVITKSHPHTANEFMHITEGSVYIIDKTGKEEKFSAGESLILPKGITHIWKQTESVKMFYFIFDDPSGSGVENSENLNVIRIDPHTPLSMIPVSDTSRIEGKTPKWYLHNYYTDVSERMNIGIWGTTEFHEVPWTTDHPELMHILEGSVTFTNGEGVKKDFHAGDTLLAPTGMSIKWDSEAYAKKIYCSVGPEK